MIRARSHFAGQAMRNWGLYRLEFDSRVLAGFTPKDDGIQSSAFSDKPLTLSSLGLNGLKLKIEFLQRSASFEEGVRRRQWAPV